MKLLRTSALRFSLILPCLSSIWSIASDSSGYSGDQTDGNEGSWQSPYFAERHTSGGICVLQAAKCFNRLCHESSFSRISTRGFRCGVERLADTKHWGTVWRRKRGCVWSCCSGRVRLGRLRYLWHIGRKGPAVLAVLAVWAGRLIRQDSDQFLYWHVVV